MVFREGQGVSRWEVGTERRIEVADTWLVGGMLEWKARTVQVRLGGWRTTALAAGAADLTEGRERRSRGRTIDADARHSPAARGLGLPRLGWSGESATQCRRPISAPSNRSPAPCSYCTLQTTQHTHHHDASLSPSTMTLALPPGLVSSSSLSANSLPIVVGL